MSVANAFTLYTWNLVRACEAFFNYNFLNYSLVLCRLGYFIQYTSLQIVAWMLVKIENFTVYIIIFS